MTLLNKPILQLKGRSGCNIELVKNNKNYFVRKTSSSILYNDRLFKQSQLQKEFAESINNSSFITPRIFNHGKLQDDLFYFDMEYALGSKFSDYFSNVNKDNINIFFSNLISYFENNLNHSTEAYIPNSIIKKKISDIISSSMKFDFDFIKKVAFYLDNNIPISKLPIGYCHGDFTFSNILFKSNKEYYLLDFLDSFINSPIIDIVKFKQDSKFYWSIFIDENLPNHKKIRSIQVLSHLNSNLDLYLKSKYMHYIEWIDYLEVLNLFRIIPYINNESDYIFLKNNLTKILNL